MIYLLTFRTYGTWLHGDERGSVDNRHNQWQEPLLEENARLQNFRRKLMKAERVVFDEEQRQCVAQAIYGVAHHRGWMLHAIEVLSNHVHVVVRAEEKPEKMVRDFKAWSTRRLREKGLVPDNVPLWSHHASTRYLRSEESFHAACEYVRNQQNPERE